MATRQAHNLETVRSSRAPATKQRSFMVFDIETLPSAWKGHRKFTEWLMQRLQPKVSVELGVDYGYSLFCMAKEKQGQVYGVDLFIGDEHAGHHNDAEAIVHQVISKNQYNNITIIKQDFNQAAASWNKPIDLLHIDGLHTYEAVKNDWEKWTKHLTAGGVVIMHDTVSYDGVRQFYNEISWPKLNFTQSAGLGVASRDAGLIKEIEEAFNINKPALKVWLHLVDGLPKCRPIAEKITNALIESDLIINADVQIHCNYNANNYEWLYNKTKQYKRCQLVFPVNRPEESEVPTLRAMKTQVDIDPTSSYNLYLHHKGVTHETPAVDDWLDYMLYFNVYNWRESVKQLTNGYDTCGVNWWGQYHYPHYSGNFWWATSDYLKRLPAWSTPQVVGSTSQFGLECGYRNDAEFWIGLGKPNPYNMHESNLDHYKFRYPAFMYK